MALLTSSKKGTSIFPLLGKAHESTALEIVGPLPRAPNFDIYYQRSLGFCLGLLFATVIHLII